MQELAKLPPLNTNPSHRLGRTLQTSSLNKMLRPGSLLALLQPLAAAADPPEIRPEVHNLPRPESNEQESSREAKPLDARVGALVGVAELLLAGTEVVHLGNHFGHHLFDAAQLRLDRLELLGGLDGRPVLCIGANIDIELDVSAGLLDVFRC